MASDLRIYRGDSKTWELEFKNEAGTPIDITGWTVYFTVKERDTDTDLNAKINKTIILHSDPTNGKTNIVLIPADTINLKGIYYYDIRIKTVAGTISTVESDSFEIIKNIRTTT